MEDEAKEGNRPPHSPDTIKPLFSERMNLRLALIKEMLAGKKLPEEIAKETALIYGKPGEASKYVPQKIKDTFALMFADMWRDDYLKKNKEHQVEPGTEKQVLDLHKQIDNEQVCSEVVVLPDGKVIIQMMPELGYSDAYFPLVNHANLAWNPETKMWILNQFSFLNKLGLLEKQLEAGAEDAGEIIQQMLSLNPTEQKSFGKLDNAVRAAKEFLKRGTGLASKRMIEKKKEKDQNAHRKAIAEAEERFKEIPLLKSLEPDQDEVTAIAQQFVEDTLPSLYDWQKIYALSQAQA